MKKITAFAIAGFLLTFSVSQVCAKRLLPHLLKTQTKTTQGIATSVKFRADRKAINVSFGSLGKATKIEYLLTYNTNAIEQGSKGTIIPASSNTEAREFLFGTCSKGICRYDTNIKDAKFVVTTSLTNGKKIIKTFRLKV